MHATRVLQRCLAPALAPMHALRSKTLLLAVESLLAGRCLVLIDLARSWIGAERIRAPLKRLDRLLGNPRLHAERERLYGGMVRWLVRNPAPIILVDWCRLKADGQWHLLRAAVPVGGRTLTLLEMVFPQRLLASPTAERHFLQRLKTVLPEHTRPILVTDAGFRAPWCRTVEALGWHWVTRLRHRTHVKPADIADMSDQWAPCHALHGLVAQAHARDLGMFDLVRSQPLQARLVLYAKAPQGRCHTTLKGGKRRSKSSRQCARREAEPWLLAVSPSLHDVSVPQVIALYRRRMQIELGFRDLKIAPVWPGLRGQPDPQERAHRNSALAAYVGRVCRVAGRHGGRGGRLPAQAQPAHRKAKAVLANPPGLGGPDSTMADATYPGNARCAPLSLA